MRQRVYTPKGGEWVFTLRLRRRARNEYSPWDSGEWWGTGIHPNTPGEGRGTGIQPETQERGGKRVFTLWGTGIHPEIQERGRKQVSTLTQERGGERVSIMKFRIGVGNGYPSRNSREGWDSGMGINLILLRGVENGYTR